MFLVHRNSLFSPSDWPKEDLNSSIRLSPYTCWSLLDCPLDSPLLPTGPYGLLALDNSLLTRQKRTLDYPPFGMSLHRQFLHLRLFSQGESLSLERSGARNSYEWALGVNSKLKNKTSSQKSQEKVTVVALHRLSCCLSNRQLILLDEVAVSSRHGHYEENGIRETQNGHCAVSVAFHQHCPPTHQSPQTVPKHLICFSDMYQTI